MDAARKRELAQAYKERASRLGVYALRCAATGQTWVSASRNLDAQRNSAFFALRTGSHPNKALQAVWAAQGADAFAYEEVEQIEVTDLSSMAVSTLLAEREQACRDRLNAARVTG